MASSPPEKTCDNCRAELMVVDSWDTKSPPLIGTRVEYAEYSCGECGAEYLLQRKGEDGDWQPA